MARPTDQPSFKANITRNKTQKWAEARALNYDGDDWGGDDDDDVYDEYAGPEPPDNVQNGPRRNFSQPAQKPLPLSTPDEKDKTLVIVRPADIYKRMQEEREKERLQNSQPLRDNPPQEARQERPSTPTRTPDPESRQLKTKSSTENVKIPDRESPAPGRVRHLADKFNGQSHKGSPTSSKGSFSSWAQSPSGSPKREDTEETRPLPGQWVSYTSNPQTPTKQDIAQDDDVTPRPAVINSASAESESDRLERDIVRSLQPTPSKPSFDLGVFPAQDEPEAVPPRTQDEAGIVPATNSMYKAGDVSETQLPDPPLAHELHDVQESKPSAELLEQRFSWEDTTQIDFSQLDRDRSQANLEQSYPDLEQPRPESGSSHLIPDQSQRFEASDLASVTPDVAPSQAAPQQDVSPDASRANSSIDRAELNKNPSVTGFRTVDRQPSIKVLTYREIVTIPESCERIAAFDAARENIAQTDTGLAAWLASLVENNPDLLRRPDIPVSQMRPASHLANPESNDHPPQAIQKSKELLGKGVVGAKGWLAKGKQKLRDSSSAKVE